MIYPHLRCSQSRRKGIYYSLFAENSDTVHDHHQMLFSLETIGVCQCKMSRYRAATITVFCARSNDAELYLMFEHAVKKRLKAEISERIKLSRSESQQRLAHLIILTIDN